MEHNALWDDVIETRILTTRDRMYGDMWNILDNYEYRIGYFRKQYKSKKAKRKLYNEHLFMQLSFLAKAFRDMNEGSIMIKDQVIINQLKNKYHISKRVKARKFKWTSIGALLNATCAVYHAYDDAWNAWIGQLEHKTYFTNYYEEKRKTLEESATNNIQGE
jgi:hypothetical protein